MEGNTQTEVRQTEYQNENEIQTTGEKRFWIPGKQGGTSYMLMI
jgi:hypothetical protein